MHIRDCTYTSYNVLDGCNQNQLAKQIESMRCRGPCALCSPRCLPFTIGIRDESWPNWQTNYYVCFLAYFASVLCAYVAQNNKKRNNNKIKY